MKNESDIRGHDAAPDRNGAHGLPPPWDRTDFRTADEKYHAMVAALSETSALQDRLSDYTETFALSHVEAEIFGINPALLPALYWAYERYENLIGSVDEYYLEFREQERTAYAQFFHGERMRSMPDAVDFMVEACKLPATQCFGWVLKITAAELRGGLITAAEDKEVF